MPVPHIPLWTVRGDLPTDLTHPHSLGHHLGLESQPETHQLPHGTSSLASPSPHHHHPDSHTPGQTGAWNHPSAQFSSIFRSTRPRQPEATDPEPRVPSGYGGSSQGKTRACGRWWGAEGARPAALSQ